MRKYGSGMVKYNIEKETVLFWCTGIDEDSKETILFNDFLLETSKNHNVFIHTYRLPNIYDIIDKELIISKSDILLDPFSSFYHIKEARFKSNYFSNACETKIYYFDKKVNWADFLSTYPKVNTEKLMQEGLLSACFCSVDQGADFWFECNKSLEKKVLNFFKDLSGFAYDIKQVSRLSFT